jgi:hypothetical protein
VDIAGRREFPIPSHAGYAHFSDIILYPALPGTRTERTKTRNITAATRLSLSQTTQQSMHRACPKDFAAGAVQSNRAICNSILILENMFWCDHPSSGRCYRTFLTLVHCSSRSWCCTYMAQDKATFRKLLMPYIQFNHWSKKHTGEPG